MDYTKDDFQEIYRTAKPQPKVSWTLFHDRAKKHKKWSNEEAEERMEDALYLSASEYKKKYSVRKTWVVIGGKKVDLLKRYSQFEDPRTSYRTFHQRIKRLEKDYMLDEENLGHAAYSPRDEWISFFGGGRRRTFVYKGKLYPEHYGQAFSSTAAFLRTVGEYDNRFTIWSRMKNGWTLDRAISDPLYETDGRLGYIYQISSTKTQLKYVGQTKVSIEERWRIHQDDALKKDSQTELHKAIRKDGPEAFQIETIEAGLNQEELDDREKYWIKGMNTLTPNGLNMRDGGSGGGNKGNRLSIGGKDYPSEAAYAAAESERTGIAEHVILSYYRKGEPIPETPRTMSKHPEAGTNLWRRWKGLVKRLKEAGELEMLSPEWEVYDNFASDVRPGFREELNLIRIDKNKAWGPGNFKWATTQEKVEQTHGTNYKIDGKYYPSLNDVARKFDIGRTTLSNRINKQGMSIEEAVKKPLGPTSKRR